MIHGMYKNVSYDGCDGMYWIAGCPCAGTFGSLNALRRYIDEVIEFNHMPLDAAG